MKSKRILLGVLAAVIVASTITWISVSRSAQPEFKENLFADSISKRDWGAIYDLHSPETWKKTRIRRAQFEKFLTCVTAKIDSDKLTEYSITPIELDEPATMQGLHKAKLVFPNLVNYNDEQFWLEFQSANTRDGWIVPAAELPIWLAQCVAINREERHLLLYECMVNAGIEEYPVNNYGLTMTQKGLGEFARNRNSKSESAIFVTR